MESNSPCNNKGGNRFLSFFRRPCQSVFTYKTPILAFCAESNCLGKDSPRDTFPDIPQIVLLLNIPFVCCTPHRGGGGRIFPKQHFFLTIVFCMLNAVKGIVVCDRKRMDG
ncbi:hypothetical protein MRB53_011948 [Persea americana]|uniref:Uncharacterized protein n=1 Tax=Persea americana TaxID=3435 RepID=A0ACC2LWD7_PERAE|nr:hypothetical protein MRB53_011948 [Persea americana]